MGRPGRIATLALAVAAALAGTAGALPPLAEWAAAERSLCEAGVVTGGPALLEFFRKRTLTGANRQRLTALVRQLGANNFAAREQATRELTAAGKVALPLLRGAVQDRDAEVARRARRCVEAIEFGRDTDRVEAAARVLAWRRPDGAVAVLLAYLPAAGDAAAEEAVLHALCLLSTAKADSALTAAVTDTEPSRRAAAGYVLGRLDAASRAAAVQLLTDPDSRVRFRAAQGFLAGADRAAVPALLALLTDGPEELAWQAEDMLRQVGGAQAPAASAAGGSPEARRKARQAWAAWWRANAGRVDLAQAQAARRLLGLQLGISYDAGQVWECGPDGRVRWQLAATGPMDAQILPGNRVLIAEAAGRRVRELDFGGKVLWEKALNEEPINCQRLPNGNTFIGLRNGVMEVTTDGQIRFVHRTDRGLHAVRRLRNGHYLYLSGDGQIGELDAEGRPVRQVQVPHEGTWGDVELLPNGRFLVANYGRGFVREVDAAGKTVWEGKVPGACGVERLPNGHVLLACPQRIVEVDRNGNIVWQAQHPGHVRRAHRR